MNKMKMEGIREEQKRKKKGKKRMELEKVGFLVKPENGFVCLFERKREKERTTYDLSSNGFVGERNLLKIVNNIHCRI